MTIQDIARETEQAIAHPLDPLSAAEITQVVAILKAGPAAADTFRFVQVALREPDKQLLRDAPERIHRESEVVLIDRATGRAYEVTVDLDEATVTSWVELPAGTQPPITLDEFGEAEEQAKRDPRVVEALAARGVTDLDLIAIEPWSAGYYGEDDEGRRLFRLLVFVRPDADGNPYAHPLEGLIIVYDINAGEVLRIEDSGLVAVPKQRGDYLPKHVGEGRSDLRPIQITSPEGRSFQVVGNEVTWADWQFRVGFTAREGLVLHQLSFKDGEERRSVLHRASLVEMVVPYGDPSPVQSKKNAFDAGEYNIGALANSLVLGCDCLGEIQYFDGVVVDSHGNPFTIANAVCLHEEDDSIQWKHYDFRLDTAEVRRSRRLVISFIATVANYEYGFYWYLYLDGTIEFQVKATGILSTAGQPKGTKSLYGQTLNKDGLYAPIHQHVFNVRLDFDLDGVDNTVYETNTVIPEDNPTKNVFYTVDTPLTTEQQAIRRSSLAEHRFWKIANEHRLNAVDEPVAYRLIPGDPVTIDALDDSWVAKRAGFAKQNLWVTPYERSERFPAGEYPNQSRGGDGLPAWTAADRDIADTDLVVWYTFGLHHVVRLEDYPVMPREQVGFKLQPHGFFDQNPTLNLPREAGRAACSAETGGGHVHEGHGGHDHGGHAHEGHGHDHGHNG